MRSFVSYIFAGVVVVGGSAGPPPAAPSVGGTPNAASVTQLLQQYLEKEKNNQLVTRIVFATPAVNVGDTFPGATTGVVDYSLGNFKLIATSLPPLTAGGLALGK